MYPEFRRVTEPMLGLSVFDEMRSRVISFACNTCGPGYHIQEGQLDACPCSRTAQPQYAQLKV